MDTDSVIIRRTAAMIVACTLITLSYPASTRSTDYVIFTVEMAQAEGEWRNIYLPIGERPDLSLGVGVGELPYYEPSPISTEAFKAALVDHLRANPDVTLMPLSEYRFQFVGLTIEGKQILFANAFCKSHWQRYSYWRTNLVLVDDGGNCYFKAVYDPGIKSIMKLMVNGKG